MKLFLKTTAALMIFIAVARAQAPQFNSPEVNNGRVTVRVYQPNAKKVTLLGEWDDNAKKEMTQDAQGVWSYTTDVLPANVYEYGVQVDDVPTLDVKNPYIKGLRNLIEVPGTTPQYYEAGGEPKGAVHIQWYDSKATGTTRRLHVYTPPGYGTSRQKYPVLYLLHGSGDDDSGWSSYFGRANVILDKLIAQKQAVPMIVVMPMGHVRIPGRELSRLEQYEVFEKDLIGDVLPLVEKSYRTQNHRTRRALAGLSMGGGQTVVIGLKHPELFSAYGVFSAGIWEQTPEPFANAIRTFKASRYPNDLLWIGIGKRDFVYARSQVLLSQLRENNVPFIYHEDNSVHSWPTWRDYLHRFAPLLFRKK